MAEPKHTDSTRTLKCIEKPCCQALLQEVMEGAVPADQYVERMLDHLERTT